MKILERKDWPSGAALYLARLRPDPESLVEFGQAPGAGTEGRPKWILHVAAQFGCPVGCRMCDAGALGYGGNLTAEEIVEQIRRMAADNKGLDIAGQPNVEIRLERMGEPSLNPQVLRALKLLAEEFPRPGILPWLSTVAPKSPAVAPFFKELIGVKNEFFSGGRFQLQFSLHSTDEKKRTEIVPIKKWSLDEIARYGERFFSPGDRKIILSFAPAPEERLDAAVLCRVFPPDKFAVKITPVYRTGAADRSGATHPWRQAPASLRDLAHELNSRGLEAFLNPLPLQVDLQAVFCGQLWSAKLKAKAAVIAANRAREAQSYVSSGTLAAKALSWQRETAGLRRREFPLRWERAGLMVMDMQRIFMDPRSRAYLPAARAIAANVRRLAEAFKRAGRPAYFVFHPHENPSRAEIAAILSPFAEKTFLKRRYNAFSNAALEKALRRDKIEELVFAGVTTNLCVESTLRDAFDKGFLCFLALDASAARTEDLHLASLKNLSYGFSTLRTTDEILSFLPAD